MSEGRPLLSLLQEWRQCTLAEGRALRALDWPGVKASQQAKRQLQAQLGLPLGGVQERLDPPVRLLVDELITLETANGEWIAAQAAARRSRLSELKGSARNLTRLRNSYSCRKYSHWQSYS